MLLSLSIRDFVIVDSAELEFGPGMNVLTGETGAGKSILLEAMGYALGERVSGDPVRQGRTKAEISARFDVRGLPAAKAWLAERDLLDDSGEAVFRRVIERDGRSRAFINGRATAVQEARTLADLLLIVHGQHENQALARMDEQRALLDRFAQAGDLVQAVRESYAAWKQLHDERVAMEARLGDYERERDELTWHVGELSKLAFDPAAWQQTLSDHGRIAHASDLIRACNEVEAALSEGDSAIESRLRHVTRVLADAASLDMGLKPVAELFASAEATLADAARDLARYRDRIEVEPERLTELDRRIAEVQSAARKYRTEPARLPEALAEYQRRLKALPTAENLDAATAAEQGALSVLEKHAKRLTDIRRKAAEQLSREVTALLAELAMNGARFEAALVPAKELGPHGAEQVEYQVATNAGQPLAAMTRIASGGELARIALALQTVLSRAQETPVMIFDEVDQGIGGRVAEIVGQLMQRLAREKQVLAVTHLPQVAAYAGQQYRVAKLTSGESSVVQVKRLTEDERGEELARMMGGVTVSDATRKAARELAARAHMGEASPATERSAKKRA